MLLSPNSRPDIFPPNAHPPGFFPPHIRPPPGSFPPRMHAPVIFPPSGLPPGVNHPMSPHPGLFLPRVPYPESFPPNNTPGFQIPGFFPPNTHHNGFFPPNMHPAGMLPHGMAPPGFFRPNANATPPEFIGPPTPGEHFLHNIHPAFSKNLNGEATEASSPIPCPLCNQTFTCHSDLRRHHMNVHEGKHFACQVPGCSVGFGELETLRQHSIYTHGFDLDDAKNETAFAALLQQQEQNNVMYSNNSQMPEYVTMYKCADCEFLLETCDELYFHHDSYHSH